MKFILLSGQSSPETAITIPTLRFSLVSLWYGVVFLLLCPYQSLASNSSVFHHNQIICSEMLVGSTSHLFELLNKSEICSVVTKANHK